MTIAHPTRLVLTALSAFILTARVKEIDRLSGLEPGAIDSHIKNVRRKLADAGCEEERIRSILGFGYKLE